MSLSHSLGSSQNTLLPGEWNPFPRAYLLAFPHSALFQSYFHQMQLCVTHWTLLPAFIPTPKAHPEPGRAQIKCIESAKTYVWVFHTLMKNLNEIFTYVKSSFSALCHPAFIGSSAILSISCDIVVVQLLSCVQLFGTPWTAAHQAFLSLTISQSLLKLMSIELVMPSRPLSSPSPPAFNLSQHQSLFQWVGSSH